MKNTYINRFRLKHLIALCAMLCMTYWGYAQTATLVVTTPEVCDGNQSIFFGTANNLPSGVNVTSYEWTVSGFPPVTNTQASYIFAYPPGSYTMTLKINFSDGTSATTPPQNFTVFYKPIPSFSVVSAGTQCFRGNLFNFTSNATQNPSSPSNPLATILVGFGDGVIATFPGNVTSFSHSYNAANNYTPFILVTDTKGCQDTQFLQTNAVIVKPNIAPDFTWAMTQGPCFISCYRFTNTSPTPVSQASAYTWDFGDGKSFSATTVGNPQNYDTITHCYTKNGQFSPALIITDNTGCIDSTRKSPVNTTTALPRNIKFEFDVVTLRNVNNPNEKGDSVCVQSGNGGNICFRMTPVSFATPGTGDFVWDFGDPNDPQQRNLDSNSWNPCHQYSGMGHFVPRITIKNVCPDTTFIYHSAVSTYSVFDSTLWNMDMDYGPNMTPPPPLNSVGFNLPPLADFQDSINLEKISPELLDSVNNNGPFFYVYGYRVTTSSSPYFGDTVYFRRAIPIDTSGTILNNIRIPVSFIMELEYTNYIRRLNPVYKPAVSPFTGNDTFAVIRYDSFMYAFKTIYERPIYYFSASNPVITYPSGGVRSNFLLSWHLLNHITKRGYGVYVTGPFARIENPPAMILLSPNHKRQCGPRDTVDFRNTQVNYKSRKTWRRWDFDDNFAPQCTSYALPKNGNLATVWPDAISQDRGSYHFFYQNGRMYPGRVHCRYSHDTLPRHYYMSFDSIYLWYRYGHDFFPWDPTQFTLGTPNANQIRVTPWDAPWWGAPVYINILTGEWSKTQDSTFLPYYIYQRTYFDSIQNRNVTVDEAGYVNMHDTMIKKRWYGSFIDTSRTVSYAGMNGLWYKWPRIDSMDFRQNNGQDLADTMNQILMQNVPDPEAIARGKYPYTNYNLNGNMDRNFNQLQTSPDGDSWLLRATTRMVNGDTLYRYAFRRTIQRCLTVRQRIRDSANNETDEPGMQYDAYGLDRFDCEGEGTVQLAFGDGDAYGLGISGKLCIGSFRDEGAFPTFEMGNVGRYPGVVPNCGQSFIIMNLDSTADRRDATPCELDGFTTFTGGITPGGLVYPNFHGLASDYNVPPIPNPWANPNGTRIFYHYAPNHHNIPTPLPADQLGWVTVGVAIGNGSKDTIRTNVLLSQYKSNPAVFQTPITAPVQNPVGGIAITGAGGFPPLGAAQYNYTFSHIFNYRPITVPTLDTLIDIVYIDNNYPKCVSSVVWYHRFLRLGTADATFEMFPAQCWHRGINDTVTVFYLDSIQDSIKFSVWNWADGTITVDSFWYAGKDTTDNFYDRGMRRVRYNIDLVTNTLIDSTVWPIFASGPGATDGLRPRVKFKEVPYDTLDFCQTQIQGVPVRNPNPPTYIVDTAMMFMPISHIFVRSSWQAGGSTQTASPLFMGHTMITTNECRSSKTTYFPIGVIDTFITKKGSHLGEYDNTFCENEPVYFYDSVRYWRYDCSPTVSPFNPNVSKPRMPPSPITADPNTDWWAFNQWDPYDFWREAEFAPNVIRGVHSQFRAIWNAATNRWDTLWRRGNVFAERMYWDFGDGSPMFTGTRPVHQYANFGRYKVTMVTMDSLGWYDTCVSFVNIVKPIAQIFSNTNVFGCADPALLTDTSFIDFGNAPNTVDRMLNNYWWFGENKVDTLTPISINRKDVGWIYRSNGKFTVKLVVETEQGCFDTAFQDVFIQGPRPAFRLLSDTLGCAPLRVRLINLADSAGGISPADTPTVESIVYWGDGNFTIVSGRRDTVEYTYKTAGAFSILVAGRDAVTPNPLTCPIVYAPDTVNGLNRPVMIYVYEYPASITGDRRNICVGDELEITNASDSNFTQFTYYINDMSVPVTVDSITNVQGPATAGNPIITRKRFDASGLFEVVSYPTAFSSNVPVAAYENCRVTDTIQVRVNESVADFNIDSTNIPRFLFTNTSQNAVRYEWTVFNDQNEQVATKNGSISDPDYNIDLGDNKGTFRVCLASFTADSLGACPDTICKEIVNQFTTDFKLYNVFSPNGDNTNDQFVVEITGADEYEILIYNRWGGKVFESTDVNKHWNGKTNNDGQECPAGVYYYIINYKLKAQDKKSVNGTVTLIR